MVCECGTWREIQLQLSPARLEMIFRELALRMRRSECQKTPGLRASAGIVYTRNRAQPLGQLPSTLLYPVDVGAGINF